jgi:hypothetical protein
MRAAICVAILTLAGPCLWAQQRLELPNETTIELLRDAQGNYLGLGAVSICGVPVSLPGLPMTPLVETRGGADYAPWRVDAVDSGARCAIVGRLPERRSGREDQLRLIIRPEEMAIGGKWYLGFAYQYVFSSEADEVLRITDRTHWELGGTSDGLYLSPPHRLTSREPLVVPRTTEFLRTPACYFQGGRSGTLVVAYDFDDSAPLIFTRLDKSAGAGAIRLVDEVNLVPGISGHTPWRHVLLCKQDRLEGLAFEDEATRCQDFFSRRLRDRFAVPYDTPRRLSVRFANGWEAVAPEQAREVLLEAQALGFEQLIQGMTGGVGTGFPTGTDATDALARLSAEADLLGMRAAAWVPVGHVASSSPLLATNPEWFLRTPQGTMQLTDAGRVAWCDLNSDYTAGWLEAVRKLQDAGITSVWLGGFGQSAQLVNSADPRRPSFNIRPALAALATLRNNGFDTVMADALAPLGIASPVVGRMSAGAADAYRSAPLVQRLRPSDANWYFTMLANGATPILALRSSPGLTGAALSDLPDQATRVTYANEAFRRVRDAMGIRTLLRADEDPWRCVGTRWTSTDGRTQVYWPYVDYRAPLEEGQRAYEVASGEEVRMESMGALMRGEHVYVVEQSYLDE